MRILHPLIAGYIKRTRSMTYKKFVACREAKHLTNRNAIWFDMWREGVPLDTIAYQSGKEKRYVARTIKELRTERGVVRKKPAEKEKIHPYTYVLALRAISKTDPKYAEKAEKLITKLAEYYEEKRS